MTEGVQTYLHATSIDHYVQYHVMAYMHNNTYIIISQIYITNTVRYA